MNKIRKLLIPALFLCLTLSGTAVIKSNAEETQGEQASAGSALEDENPERLEEVTGMDENGDIYEVDDSEGTVEQPKIRMFSRAASVQVVNFRTKGNATTNYTEYGTGASGYTNGAYGADAAYLGTYNGRVRFMLSGVVGEVAASEVQLVDFSSAKSVSCYKVSDGRLLHYITQDMSTTGHATSLDNGNAPSYLSGGTTYYSYDGHYFYTDYAVMLADYQNQTRSNSVNAGSPYYNYYQYLPLRSTSSYSAAQLNSLINAKAGSSSKMYNIGEYLTSAQNTYGVNALLIAGVGANESGWGKSSISHDKNNLFGLNAVDSSPGTSASTYASVQECIRQFADGWMSRGYLDTSDWRYKGGFLGNKGSGINVSYASDPYWGERAANLIWYLDRNGGGQDANAYSIGIKDTINTTHNSVNVRNGSNTSSTALYKTGAWSNYAVLIQNTTAENGFYRIQSDSVLTADRSAIVTSTGAYNFDQMYAYISADYVTLVNQGANTEVKKELSSIYVSQAPSKVTYTAGENFDPAGIIVMAKWSDGSETDVTQDVTYSAGVLQSGTASVTVTYTSEGVTKTVQQAVTVTDPVTVDAVSINPAQVELHPGDSLTFGIAVTGSGNPSSQAEWSVSGAVSADTKIDANGRLQIGADETAQSLTVTAVPAADTSKSAAATVTIVPAETPDESSPSGDPEVSEPIQEPDETPDADEPETETPDAGTEDPVKTEESLQDEATGIWVKGTFAEGTTVTAEPVAEGSDQYASYIEPVKNHTILGVYDIKLSQELADGESVQLGVPIDAAYNGQEFIILHYTEKDGQTFQETYKDTIEDGQAVIQVAGFSPYVIALNDAPAEEPENVDTDVAGTDNAGTDAVGTDSVVPPANMAPSTGENSSTGTNSVVTGNEITDTQDSSSPSNQTDQGSDTTTNGTTQTTDNKEQTIDQTQDTSNAKNTQNGQNTTSNPSENQKQNKSAPKTGDDNQIGIWIVMLCLAVAGVAYWVYEKKKSVK